MARNEEKAQSMLYRFREAQAAELGLGTRSDKRPRMASSCKSLRECERWRGEILREISRKVSKIQDAGLSDYEVRDLNDEINKLMREKRHWENQIIALGGANYRRNVAMLDADGKEVPGTKGYKFVSILSIVCPGSYPPLKTDTLEEQKNYLVSKSCLRVNQKRKMRTRQPLNSTKSLRTMVLRTMGIWTRRTGNCWSLRNGQNSMVRLSYFREIFPFSESSIEYREAVEALKDVFDLVDESKLPAFRDKDVTPINSSAANKKRKDKSGDQIMEDQASSFIPFLTPEQLAPPKLPTKEEMETILLELRKRTLLQEYLGDA
ncbi:NineTeen Complex (NTC) component [Serendipita sp. 396]|nr:NineTeen Complex (NTC) component [Serendipita sp. 396]